MPFSALLPVSSRLFHRSQMVVAPNLTAYSQPGYSAFHLSRKFKREMGVSISAYIKFTRIERSKVLLTATDEPVHSIAARLRYCSSSHFSSAFQDVVGKKPQEYRREMRKV